MKSFTVRDEGTTFTIKAENKKDLHQQLIAGYDREDKTYWVRVWIDDERVRLEIPPQMPRCTRKAHEWHDDIDVVGGIKENPGVMGHGGGVIVKEACRHCSWQRITDTWAQDPNTGEQGLTSVRYVKVDDSDADSAT